MSTDFQRRDGRHLINASQGELPPEFRSAAGAFDRALVLTAYDLVFVAPDFEVDSTGSGVKGNVAAGKFPTLNCAPSLGSTFITTAWTSALRIDGRYRVSIYWTGTVGDATKNAMLDVRVSAGIVGTSLTTPAVITLSQVFAAPAVADVLQVSTYTTLYAPDPRSKLFSIRAGRLGGAGTDTYTTGTVKILAVVFAFYPAKGVSG